MKSKEKIKCPICGKVFEAYISAHRKYCSASCGAIASKGRFIGNKNSATRPEVRQKMSKSQRKRFSNKANHPNTGKHLKPETRFKISESVKKAYKTGRLVLPNLGKKLSKETRQKISKNHFTKKPGYQKKYRRDAKSRQVSSVFKTRDMEYSTLFASELKSKIFKRDNYTCKICGKYGRVLHCHHIDYDKWNNALDNFATLCNSCHAKTNRNRKFWSKKLGRVHRKYSLLIGRYQVPKLHGGHIGLIKYLLDEGKNVLVAMRLDDGTIKNPYSWWERIEAFENLYKEEIFAGRIMVIPFPDITEVCYGRKVGWGIRQIHLDEKTEAISATEIRKGEK